MKHLTIKLSNPLLIYVAVWTFQLFLVKLQLTSNLPKVNANTLILVWANIASFIVIFILLSMIVPYRPKGKPIFVTTLATVRLMRFAKKLLYMWGVGTIIEIVYSRGVPLLWAFSGGINKNYTNFGIPTFHGLMNSLFFFSITAFYMDYLIRRNRSSLIISILLLAWPVAMLGRGILFGAMFQMIGVYLTLYRVSLGNFVKLAFVALIMIWAFGLIGDTRGTTKNPFSYLVDAQHREFFDRLPSGFLWFYVYVTAPLSNIIVNIDSVEPDYLPYNSATNLIPSAIRTIIFPKDKPHDSLELIDQNLNVSTIYENFLPDFGMGGAFIIVAVIQFVVTFIYLQARRRYIWATLAYAVFFQCIVFSIFYELFLVQVYIFQILIALYFGRQEKRLYRTIFYNINKPSFSDAANTPHYHLKLSEV